MIKNSGFVSKRHRGDRTPRPGGVPNRQSDDDEVEDPPPLDVDELPLDADFFSVDFDDFDDALPEDESDLEDDGLSASAAFL